MDDELHHALELLIGIDRDGHLFDRESREGRCKSQELEDALGVIETALARA